MDKLLDLLAKGKYQGLTALAIVSLSGIGPNLTGRIEEFASSFNGETSHDIVLWGLIIVGFALLISVVGLVIVLILRDTGLINRNKPTGEG